MDIYTNDSADDSMNKYLESINAQIPDGYKLHISKKGFVFAKKVIKQKIGPKSHGLWTSGKFNRKEQSWTDWCLSEMPHWLDTETHDYHAVKIAQDPKLILTIDTGAKLEEFQRKYIANEKDGYLVYWNRVQEDGYYGIDFSRYLYEYRLKPGYMWYYTLDCASQCIWNTDAIEDIIKLS